MNKAIATIFVIFMLVAMQIVVMIYGWGLEPKSWGIIIGVGFFGTIIMRLIGDKVLKSDN